MAIDAHIQVSVVYSPAARQVREINVLLKVGGTVLQALQASTMLDSFLESHPESTELGVWGRKVDLCQSLRDHDRVEIYRSLRVDPKVARRERFKKQGSRGTGLFENRPRRTKSGY
jgi:putative ubiquitin-RnfH superfamily antitoxin RatB of RatAB toxin-antitoxin module